MVVCVFGDLMFSPVFFLFYANPLLRSCVCFLPFENGLGSVLFLKKLEVSIFLTHSAPFLSHATNLARPDPGLARGPRQ